MEAQENKDIVAEIKRILGKEWVGMSVKKARKKPVEIEFIQFTDKDSVMDILFWAKSKVKYKTTKNYIIINTLEGEMTANVDDYIVKGVNGEFYPVKPDIFNKTYEVIE